MNILIGQYSLAFAAVVAVIVILCSAIHLAKPAWPTLKLARWLVGLFFLLLCVCSGSLWIAFLSDDFTVAYVAGYSEHALPTAYKMAAFWAGQEGSLLLWAVLLGGMSAVAVFQWRHHTGRQAVGELFGLMLVSGFFAVLMVFAANPFKLMEQVVTDGNGLNPMLQDPAMIAHPPLLFIGYAGYTIPFAAMIGALFAGGKDFHWILAMRRWLIFSWLFLTMGIMLGAWWAYIELGWGGYWARDPVENASLLPWLTGTALLHSIVIPQLKRWNVFLVTLSFLLCLFGTYITRSGVIQSVHAFGESLVGTFFLIFLGVCAVLSLVLIFWRFRSLQSGQCIDHVFSKPGLFLITNILLTLMMLITLVGTIFPLISSLFMPEPVSVGPAFYNQVILPLAIVVFAIMCLGPMLTLAPDVSDRIKRGIQLPSLLAVIAVGVAYFVVGIVNPWSLVCTGLAVFGFAVILAQLYVACGEYRQTHDVSGPQAIILMIDANHRRYGGQTIHLGMLLFMIGVVGSGVYGTSENHRMDSGDEIKIGNQTLTYYKLAEAKRGNYTAVETKMTLTDANGAVRPLQPELRFYPKSEKANTHVGLDCSLSRDIYVTLSGWEAGGTVAALVVRVNPLVTWIWIGSVIATLGAMFSMLPALLKPAGVCRPHVARPLQTEQTNLAVATTPLTSKSEKGNCES